MKLETLIWGIPLPIGLAAYLWTASHAVAPRQEAPGQQTTARERAPRRDITSADGIDRMFAEIQIAGQARDEAGLKELSGLSEAELKEEIAALIKLLTTPGNEPDPFGDNSAYMRLIAAGEALGAKAGFAGVSWMEGNYPDEPMLYQSCVSGWAEAEPEAVFRYICDSKTANPSSPATLMQLLKRYADNPSNFRHQVERVPWELFTNLTVMDPFSQGVYLPDEDVGIWIESGAARSLAEQGFQFADLFSRWAAADLPAAIAGWSDWTTTGNDKYSQPLAEILSQQFPLTDGPETLTAELGKMDTETAAKFREEFTRMNENVPNLAARYLGRFPVLAEFLPADSRPGHETHPPGE